MRPGDAVSALVLAIGLLVDDAIVVVENVERIMRTEGLSPRDATIKSMGEITQCASALAIAVAAINSKNPTEPNRRAIGGPNATSQIILSSTWVHEPCKTA